jgi:tetratricopeptide (TPR) repeat protein
MNGQPNLGGAAVFVGRAVRGLRGAARRPWRTLAIVGLLAVIGVSAWFIGRHVWAGYQYRAARRALERYQFAQAQRYLEDCLAVWPSSFEVCLLAAQTARRQGDYEKAEQLLARCQQIRQGLADEVVLEQALIKAQRGGMDAVLPYVRSLVEKHDPASLLIFEAMAQGYIRKYRAGDAAAVLALWRERAPDDLQANFLQGFVRELVGPEQEALDNYRKVLEIDPEHYEARLRLAILLTERAQPAEALKHLEYLAQQRPSDAMTLVRLAQCHLALGQPGQANQELDQVLAKQPRFRAAVVAKGQVLLQLDRPAEAEPWLRQALVLDGADFQANFALTRCLRLLGKDTEADAAENRLKVLETDIKRIRDIIKKDINRTPNDPRLRTEIGTILIRGGSVRDGVQWLYNALQLDPAYAPAHAALADHFEREGRPEQAAPHRRFLEGRTQPGDGP